MIDDMKVLKKNIYFILVLFSSTILLSACSKDDKSSTETSRMFRPISLELISGTKEKQDYIVSFPSVRNAAGYTLRISTTADFSTDVEEFPIDPVASSTVQYTITNSMLSNRTDLYDFYITVKAKSKDGQDYDSKFCTPVLISPYRQNLFANRKKEFLFSGAGKTDTVASQYLMKDNVTLKWDSTQTATKILVKDTQGNIVTDYPLTDADRLSKQVIISGLTPETNYVAFLYEGTLSLGRVKFKTTSASEKIISVATDGSDLSTIIANAADGSVLRLKNDGVYSATAQITINKNITIESFQETHALVSTMKGFMLDGSLQYFNLRNVDFVGTGNSSANSFIGTTASTFTGISNLLLQGCVINTFNNLINYGGVSGSIFENIIIDRSFVSNMMASLHTIDLRAMALRKLTITNSTFYNLGRGIIRVGSDIATPIITDQYVTISNNTFYKCNVAPNSHFLYFGKTTSPHTGTYLIVNNIFSTSSLSTGGFAMAGYCVLKSNNFYAFTFREAERIPASTWGGTKAWGEISNNNGDVAGSNGYAPNFIDPDNGDFTPKTKALNTMAPGAKPVGAPYWVKSN